MSSIMQGEAATPRTDRDNILDFLAPYYQAGCVVSPDGRRLEIENGIDPKEVLFLYDLIASDKSVSLTLEVGCGLGFSAYAICSALRTRDGRHTIVDPFQERLFGRAGTALVEKAGLDNFILVERGSEFYLPELAEGEPGQLDLVFIDGLHTFDHTMIDLFYASRLIRVGGYIVIDDCSWPMVSRAVSYVAQYPAYEFFAGVPEQHWKGVARRLISSAFDVAPAAVGKKYPNRWRFPRMVALKKVAEDNRPSDWRARF